MDAGVCLVLVVLDVFVDCAVGVNGEDVAVEGMVVEGVSVDAVWWFLGGEEKDCSSVCVGGCGFSWVC